MLTPEEQIKELEIIVERALYVSALTALISLVLIIIIVL